MEYLYIDRIEDGFAMAEKEDGSLLKISLQSLPENIQEGAAFFFENGIYIRDKAKEQERKKKILELQKKIFKDEKG